MLSYCRYTSSLIKGSISLHNKVKTSYYSTQSSSSSGSWPSFQPLFSLSLHTHTMYFYWGDFLKIPKSVVFCHTSTSLNMPFALPRMTIASEIIHPNTFTMLNIMKDFHKDLWNVKHERALDCICELKDIIQSYWKMLNLNNPWTCNDDYLLHCPESSSDTAHFLSLGT